jgi:hypothetical protein
MFIKRGDNSYVMIAGLLEVPALFKPIVWLSIISAVLAIFTIVSIILKDGRDIFFLF